MTKGRVALTSAAAIRDGQNRSYPRFIPLVGRRPMTPPVGMTNLWYEQNCHLERSVVEAFGSPADSVDVEVAVQLPLADAVVIALPFICLYLDVVIRVLRAQRVAHHLILRQCFDRRVQRWWQMADASRLQLAPRNFVQIAVARRSRVDAVTDPVQPTRQHRRTRE